MSVDKKISLLVLFLGCITSPLFCQITIQGTVTQAESGQPISNVNVYLAGTTYGQSTDQQGKYQFSFSSRGQYNLVFSFVGYEKQVYQLELAYSTTITQNVTMKPQVEELAEVEVKASNEQWQERYEMFFDQFIGKTKYALETTIENPWVLNFVEQDNRLIANTHKPIIIKNRALGYNIYIELVMFEWPENRDEGGGYKIYSRFEPLESQNQEQRHRWERNRLENYLGSFTHFLKCLYYDNLHENNFNVEGLQNLKTLSKGETQYKLMSVPGISQHMRETLKGYELHQKVEVDFQQTIEYRYNGKTHSLSIAKKGAITPNTDDEIFYVTPNGLLLDPISLTAYDNWGNERVANNLPTNYTIDEPPRNWFPPLWIWVSFALPVIQLTSV